MWVGQGAVLSPKGMCFSIVNGEPRGQLPISGSVVGAGSARWHVHLPSRTQPVTGAHTDEGFLQEGTHGGSGDGTTEGLNLLL